MNLLALNDLIQNLKDNLVLSLILGVILVLIVILLIVMIALAVKDKKNKKNAEAEEMIGPAEVGEPERETSEEPAEEPAPVMAEEPAPVENETHVEEEEPAQEAPVEEKIAEPAPVMAEEPVKKQPAKTTKPAAKKPAPVKEAKPAQKKVAEPAPVKEKAPAATDTKSAPVKEKDPVTRKILGAAYGKETKPAATKPAAKSTATTAKPVAKPAAKTTATAAKPAAKKSTRELAKATAALGKWIITKDGERYAFRLVASNGEVMLTSSISYASLSGAKDGIETYKNNIAKNQFDVMETKNGDYIFRLFNARHTLLATGSAYKTRANCESAVESTKRWAATAMVSVGEDE